VLFHRKPQQSDAEITHVNASANGAGKDDDNVYDLPLDDMAEYDKLAEETAVYDNPINSDDVGYSRVQQPPTTDDRHAYQPLYGQPGDTIGQRNVPELPADRPITYLELLDGEGKSDNVARSSADRPSTYLELLDGEGKSDNVPESSADRPATYLKLVVDDEDTPDAPSPRQNID